jgi:hypothetical protein
MYREAFLGICQIITSTSHTYAHTYHTYAHTYHTYHTQIASISKCAIIIILLTVTGLFIFLRTDFY